MVLAVELLVAVEFIRCRSCTPIQRIPPPSTYPTPPQRTHLMEFIRCHPALGSKGIQRAWCILHAVLLLLP